MWQAYSLSHALCVKQNLRNKGVYERSFAIVFLGDYLIKINDIYEKYHLFKVSRAI